MPPPFLPQEIIRAKRDGQELPDAAIEWFVRGLTDGSIGDDQVAAFAMAVFFRGMSTAERVALTLSMAKSGSTLAWDRSEIPGPVLDKHSTGGVGDKVSLVLAPLVAACGGAVPMIAGRGLGHTGGTVDKFESIPGYNTQPDELLLRRTVREVGCAVVGQTTDLAPADRRLYAIRDVTATVESIALIAASILSKKLAAGLDALAMDVKFGSGAFMTDPDDAVELATSIVDVAEGAGVRTTALLTDMNQVLGRTAGNALEVRESIDWLTGAFLDPRLDEVVFALGAEMLVSGGLADDASAARSMLVHARDTGRACERFAQMVAALGGPADLVERPEVHLAAAPVVLPVVAVRAGTVQSIDVHAVGMAIVALGGGRRRASDPVDPAVGLSAVRGIGETVDASTPIALVHARSDDDARAAVEAVRGAVTIVDGPVSGGPVVRTRIARR